MQLILFFIIRRLSNETLISRSVHPLIHPRIYQIHMWKHSNIEQSVSLVFFRVFCCYCCVCVAYLTKNSFMLFVLFFCNRKSIGKRAKAIQWRFGPQSWAGTTISSNPRAYSGMLNITWTYLWLFELEMFYSSSIEDWPRISVFCTQKMPSLRPCLLRENAIGGARSPMTCHTVS